jgi:hypothetical protein
MAEWTDPLMDSYLFGLLGGDGAFRGWSLVGGSEVIGGVAWKGRLRLLLLLLSSLSLSLFLSLSLSRFKIV